MYQALYLAYPCSVDAGTDPVVVVKKLINRYCGSTTREAKREIHKLICRLCCCDESTIDRNKFLSIAHRMRNSWDYSNAQDHTMMLKDVNNIERYVNGGLKPIFQIHSLNQHLRCKVINEIDNERILEVI